MENKGLVGITFNEYLELLTYKIDGVLHSHKTHREKKLIVDDITKEIRNVVCGEFRKVQDVDDIPF